MSVGTHRVRILQPPLPLGSGPASGMGVYLSMPFQCASPVLPPPATLSAHQELPFTSLRITMSTEPSTSTLHSDFLPIFNAALESYKRKTKKNLASHPLLPALQSCGSPEAILTVLREQIPTFNQCQNGDDGNNPAQISTFRHFHQQMRYLRGSAFSSWLVSFMIS